MISYVRTLQVVEWVTKSVNGKVHQMVSIFVSLAASVMQLRFMSSADESMRDTILAKLKKCMIFMLSLDLSIMLKKRYFYL